jgi:hypothetical protein
VVGRPNRVGRLVQSRDDGLERDRVLAADAQGGGDRRREDGLADARVGPGDEAAARYAAAS